MGRWSWQEGAFYILLFNSNKNVANINYIIYWNCLYYPIVDLFTSRCQALEPLLPPRKPDLEPRPSVVDEPAYEEADSANVRARSFPPGADFLNQSAFSAFQFGADEEDEDAWIDEDDETDGQPECQTQ